MMMDPKSITILIYRIWRPRTVNHVWWWIQKVLRWLDDDDHRSSLAGHPWQRCQGTVRQLIGLPKVMAGIPQSTGNCKSSKYKYEPCILVYGLLYYMFRILLESVCISAINTTSLFANSWVMQHYTTTVSGGSQLIAEHSRYQWSFIRTSTCLTCVNKLVILANGRQSQACWAKVTVDQFLHKPPSV